MCNDFFNPISGASKTRAMYARDVRSIIYSSYNNNFTTALSLCVYEMCFDILM